MRSRTSLFWLPYWPKPPKVPQHLSPSGECKQGVSPDVSGAELKILSCRVASAGTDFLLRLPAGPSPRKLSARTFQCKTGQNVPTSSLTLMLTALMRGAESMRGATSALLQITAGDQPKLCCETQTESRQEEFLGVTRRIEIYSKK